MNWEKWWAVKRVLLYSLVLQHSLSFLYLPPLSFLHTFPRSAVFLHFFSSALEHDGLIQGVLLPWRCLAWYRLGLWGIFFHVFFFFFLLLSSPLPGLMGKNKTQIRQESQQKKEGGNGGVWNCKPRQEKWASIWGTLEQLQNRWEGMDQRSKGYWVSKWELT